MKDLINRLRRGDKQAAARLISIIESGGDEARSIMQEIMPFTGKAHVVGITGAPGSGKSTIINSLTGLLREKNRKVGVIAVDPTSPVTGGALLGDRIRMQEHSGDRGVFIRSMATRQGTGGLSPPAADAARILDALGMDTVFLETTGVGQSETAVKRAVHTVVVVVAPGLGDDVQMMKAGIMEIGDIFLVSKGDLKSAASTVRALEDTIPLLFHGRTPPVVLASAATGTGMDRVLEEVEKHRQSRRN
ncbi:MAG TPA: methylmalonyl Co-A mutase-associated GTPase MeaB [Nitrospirota bacterium]|nr:methylmalonyl Co-A mutase-associated GTPase MeaB [Nitrospirota bacterium]